MDLALESPTWSSKRLVGASEERRMSKRIRDRLALSSLTQPQALFPNSEECRATLRTVRQCWSIATG
ncbi:uncharacterized protein L969DRAFT_51155 [Mixia osmundae IAM 14324]|uniref:Uncharacterized protein n=1 Tax=Mixia osmundae (strain CBS 9802 / IAM 14324 / JCM 22182 / KY 12970) TaxID=764103 RepID=G7EAL8_MIXOS|nr:uncharacterized protein L969DRAFT_51155 [Mixia osmundae IAM 14324]KEI38197.1 hypothetical protein L969DRAFT_51155 [Mixia osmundae IAM 14324]GAA99878.1 hypothetical protein E5Q_06581 [Mixia osmundae IAM 14324]